MKSYEEWLFKSNTDLKAAKRLLEVDLLDVASYHTQQSFEKSLKAFLVYKKINPEKTHDLEYLVILCARFDLSFRELLDYASEVKPYSFKFRYPDDILIPDKSDVERAIYIAEKVLNIVKEKIRELETGQLKLF